MDDTLRDLVHGYAQSVQEEELELLRALARIPAPSHHEERRASFVAAWLRSHGANNVQVDEAKNVICLIGDPNARELVAFAAHTDVVFDDTDELPLSECGGKLFAPGVGDDTANLVGLLMATSWLLAHPEVVPQGLGMLVVANSCEEGLGNLDGTRTLFQAYGQRIREFTSFDLYLPQCISTAVGSHRFRITVRTQGGHSYHDFGRPNAIAELCSLVHGLYQLSLPDDTLTYNVGRIEGGTTVNSIAAEASMLFEYRSTSERALAQMRTLLDEVVQSHRREGVNISIETIGIRPGGAEASEALQHLTGRNLDIIRSITGCEPDQSPASTDANIPLSLGIPANTIGAVSGALLHTRDEWIDARSLETGLEVILASMLSALR